MKLLVAAIFALALVTEANAGSFYLNDAMGLTGAVPCDGIIHDAYWQAGPGWSINFTSALSWLGVDKGGVGDVWFFVEKVSTREPFTFMAWDHYKDPTGLHQFRDDFNPPFFVGDGDGLHIAYFCQPSAKHMQIIIKAQYQ